MRRFFYFEKYNDNIINLKKFKNNCVQMRFFEGKKPDLLSGLLQ